MKQLICALLFASTTVCAGEAELVFAKVQGSLVLITTLDERNEIEGEGSGVVIEGGKVITNCHVVRGAVAIRVASGGEMLPAKLELEDTDRDLCRLQVSNLKAQPVKQRADKPVVPGESVFAIGNPLGLGLTITSGIVSGLREYQGQPYIFASTPLAPGSSGGGLFDSEGRLVAITSAMLNRGQNINLAIPVQAITELAQKGKPAKPTPIVNADPDWFDQAEIYRSAGQWDKLEVWAKQWGAQYPSAYIADNYLGLALYNLGQYDRAKKILLNATRDPKNASGRSYLAITLHALGEKGEASKFLAQALELDVHSAFYWIVRADWHIKDGDYLSALEPTREAIRREPWNERVWLLHGAALQSLGRFPEAAQAYRTTLRLSPGDVGATSGLAAVLAATGSNVDARNVLSAASSEQAYDGQSWFNIGLSEETQKNIGGAERSYRKALELNPQLPHAWHRLGFVLMATGRSQEGEKMLRKALEVQPDYPDALADLAEALRLRGENIERHKLVEKAYALAPTSQRVSYAYVALRSELRDYASILEPLQSLVRIDSKNAEYWARLGDALMRTGKADEGFNALKKAQEIDPKNPVMLSAMSSYHGQRRQYGEALSFAEQSIAINGADATAWNNKGYTLLKMNHLKEAVQSLETATKLQPDWANAWINLGEAYLRLGQLGQAIATLQTAIQLSPKAVDAKSYLAQAYLSSNQPQKSREYAEEIIKQEPNYPGGWYLLTGIYVALNERQSALKSYEQLKSLNPGAARELREKMRGRLPPGFSLP